VIYVCLYIQCRMDDDIYALKSTALFQLHNRSKVWGL